LDLVVCDGDFLNADHEYVHKNRSQGVRQWGHHDPGPQNVRRSNSVRTGHRRRSHPDVDLAQRTACPKGFRDGPARPLIVGYSFDLLRNTLVPKTIPNPNAGREHEFSAWRISTGSREAVVLREAASIASNVGEVDGQ
jgi:hypothetical protein